MPVKLDQARIMRATSIIDRTAGAQIGSEQGVNSNAIEVVGISIRYLEAGAEHVGLPLLMLHGFQFGADLFLPHPVPALAGDFHVIVPDLPGFGGSGVMDEYGTVPYAQIVFAFMDALGYRQFNLMGHSMGAQIGIAMAAIHPERIGKLMLVDSAGLPQAGPAWMNPVRMMADSSMRHYKLYPTVFRLARQARAMRQVLPMIQHEHITDRLKYVTMPTLIVWGSRDRVAPLEHGGLLAKHIPNARLAIIRGAGHMPFYQKPAQFVKLARGFFRSDE